MFGSIGMPELILIFVVALLVFGPKKLPELGRSLGKGLAEFKKASDDLKKTIEDEIEHGRQEAAEVKKSVAEVRTSLTAAPPLEPVVPASPPSETRAPEPAVPRADSTIRPA